MRPLTATIRLSHLRHNYQLLKRLHGNKMLAVVKADAYGHGAVRCARALADLADGFAVATLDEGIELREAGISAPIVMLEGVLRLAEMTAKEVMVPTPRMDMLDIDAPYEALLRTVIDTAHSRFPVYQGERENVTGILMAKDLLKLQRAPELSVRTLVRPAMFVPESKGLNDLLRAFRINRNHMAIVVDEFGRMAGLITIEDVLEQIKKARVPA